MKFVRKGGGSLEFNLYKTNNPDYLQAVVTYWDFRETQKEIIIEKTADNTTAFENFHKALKNRIELSGINDSPKGMTGTWVFYSFIKGDYEILVTDMELKKTLSYFEDIVRSKMQN